MIDVHLLRDANMMKELTTSATLMRLCDEVQDLTQSDLECVEDICRHLHTSSTETEIIVGAIQLQTEFVVADIYINCRMRRL